MRLKGVSQSQVPPAKLRPVTLKPCTKVPSTTPCMKVATSEP
jgi:pyrimidine deaminase RibD-like protein